MDKLYVCDLQDQDGKGCQVYVVASDMFQATKLLVTNTSENQKLTNIKLLSDKIFVDLPKK